MIGAVVDGAFEISHGIASQKALFGGFDDAFFNGRYEVARNGAAEDFVGELEFFAAREWFHADPAIAELAVTAGLFLVAALHTGGAADGFAVRNFRRVQLHFDTIAAFQAADDNFEMLLAIAGEQKLFGHGVAIEAQRAIFFEDLVNGRAEAVFITAGFCGDGVGDGRFWDFNAFVDSATGFFAQRVAGERVFEFCDDADIASAQFCDGLHRFAKGRGDVGKALVDAGAHVVQVRIVFDEPDITLKKVTRPAKGSAEVLNTKAETGSLAESFFRLLAVLGSVSNRPSAGEGKISAMKDRARSVPILCDAERQSTGKMRRFARLL